MKTIISVSSLLTTCLLLSACSSWFTSPAEHQQAVCTTLRSQIMFGGSTNDTRLANIENAEQASQQRAYDINNCR